jgi:hypothetical protein
MVVAARSSLAPPHLFRVRVALYSLSAWKEILGSVRELEFLVADPAFALSTPMAGADSMTPRRQRELTSPSVVTTKGAYTAVDMMKVATVAV